MEITINGKHLEITEPIRSYTEGKIEKLPRYFDRITAIHVVASNHDTHSFEVEIITHVEGHEHFVATAKAEDLYAAIDAVLDKMTRQLSEYKERLRNHKHSVPRP